MIDMELKKVGWVVGFEPTYAGITILCLRPLDDIHQNGDPNRARTGDLQRDRLAF